MRAVKNPNAHERALIKAVYLEAFPEVERIPFAALRLLAKRPGGGLWAFFDGDAFCGFTALATRGDLTYLLYLAVGGNARSRGYGSAILDLVKQETGSAALALDVEPPDEPAPNREQRLKRLAFYERNGFTRPGYRLLDGGETYEVLTCGRAVTHEEVEQLLRRHYCGLNRPVCVPVGPEAEARGASSAVGAGARGRSVGASARGGSASGNAGDGGDDALEPLPSGN